LRKKLGFIVLLSSSTMLLLSS